MAGTLKVEVCWPNDGTTWTDITADCDSMSIRRGRQHETDTVAPGTFSGTLYNAGGNYSPGAANPNVKVNRPVRVSVSVAGVVTYLFTGTLDSILTSWDGGRTAIVNVGATDGFKGLARRTMQTFYSEAVLGPGNPSIVAAFPLSEPADTTSFGSVAPSQAPPVGILTNSKYGSGTVTAGNGAGFLQGAPNATYCTFAFTGTGNTEHMTVIQLGGAQGQTGASLPSGGNWTIGAWFQVPTAPTDRATLIYGAAGQLTDPSVPTQIPRTVHLYLDSAGKVNFSIQAGATVTVTSAAAYTGGTAWHYVTASLSSDLKTMNLWVDGNNTSNVAAGPFTLLASVPWIVAGGALSPYGVSGYGLNGSLANLEFYTGVDTTLAQGIRFGYGRQMFYFTDDTGALVTDLAQLYGYNQFTAPLIVADVGNTSAVAPFDTNGKTYLDALETVTKTEQGVLYIRGDGALISRNRAARVNQASAFSLNAAAQDVTADFQVGVDDSLLFNDYAATRPGGAVVRVRDTTTTSIADYGVMTNAPSDSGAELLQLTTDNEVRDYCTYRVSQYGQPQPRTPQVTIDLKRASDLWSVAVLAEVGVRFTVTNLPAEAPSATMDFICEAVQWDASGRTDTCTLTMDTSPADLHLYATLDDNTYGLLDSMVLFY